MLEILKQRSIKKFESFEDLRKRIHNLPFPEKAVEKRLLQELTTDERHNLFTQQMMRN
jgi:putative nucleotide binding protein